MGTIFSPPSPPPPPPFPLYPLFIFECSVVDSKKRKCFRAKVYKLAEKYLAKLRPDSSDGIIYDNDNIKIKLAFEDKYHCEFFQSAVREIPSDYRKRNRDPSDIVLTITDSVTKVNVSESLISSIRRVFYSDYQSMHDDINRSALCDTASDFTNYSHVSDVFVSDEVRLRLLDSEVSLFMHKKKTEKCHLKSQSKFTNLKNDSNNIVYMSRSLHEYFDGISQLDGVPVFTLEYVNHDHQVVTRVFGGAILHVYETTVAICFISELDKSLLSHCFKDHTDVSTKRIEFCLYFEDPEAFKEYATFKADETRLKWASLAGPEGTFDD
jgi:hypothetical protein